MLKPDSLGRLDAAPHELGRQLDRPVHLEVASLEPPQCRRLDQREHRPGDEPRLGSAAERGAQHRQSLLDDLGMAGGAVAGRVAVAVGVVTGVREVLTHDLLDRLTERLGRRRTPR